MIKLLPAGILFITGLFALPGYAQDQPADPAATPAALPTPAQDKHAFGVLPNYRTVDGTLPYMPINWKAKFVIATKDSFDGPAYVLGGFFAGVSQINNTNPSFGQGVEGFAKRYAAGVADQDLGNFMTEAIMPILFHEDPRYFRKVNGSVKSRIFYAATRVLVAKTNSGHNTFNFAEVIGNGAVASIGNIYYRDERGFSPTMQRMSTQIGTDAISQVLKEFWPDFKRRWQRHKNL
jgi:hypothetical protein